MKNWAYMTSRGAAHSSHQPVFAAIAASARRELLKLLLVRDLPVTERECVAHLAATGHRPTSRVPAADRQTLHTALIHTHLPVVEDAGLINWDRDTETVKTAPHPAFDDPRFWLLLESEAEGLDAALTQLANDRRRVLLTDLRNAETAKTRRDLARELLSSDETGLDPGSDGVDEVRASLHHVHLPPLDDADLIEYDSEADRATYRDHPALEEVFTIIFEPDERVTDSYDGFFEGLKAAYTELTRKTHTEAEWPTAWRDPHHG